MGELGMLPESGRIFRQGIPAMTVFSARMREAGRDRESEGHPAKKGSAPSYCVFSHLGIACFLGFVVISGCMLVFQVRLTLGDLNMKLKADFEGQSMTSMIDCTEFQYIA
uniref:uncharacterized protein LOC105350688 isoform X1 n=1 Tax=Fragaria vesca subsp. vesca TaxID=101020 RepID=UPI0005CAF912|nr:PREDICTED: uncharacterized protein LOC105350688 isoform X1 [Fragaria vesca subsp. vesca]